MAKRIGYPLMVKAAEGGGGKGIRKVEAAEELGACFRQVRGAWSPCLVPPCPLGQAGARTRVLLPPQSTQWHLLGLLQDLGLILEV